MAYRRTGWPCCCAPFRKGRRPRRWQLTVLAAVSYVPALYGGFVWDDAIFAEEPVIHAASGLRSIWHAAWPTAEASGWSSTRTTRR